MCVYVQCVPLCLRVCVHVRVSAYACMHACVVCVCVCARARVRRCWKGCEGSLAARTGALNECLSESLALSVHPRYSPSLSFCSATSLFSPLSSLPVLSPCPLSLTSFSPLTPRLSSLASLLRNRANPDLEIAESPMRDWVEWDSGTSVSEYARRMAISGWGGEPCSACLLHAETVAAKMRL